MIQTAAIKKIFIQRGVDSILEYIGGKISTNYKQITNRTPKDTLITLVNHPNLITKAMVKIRLAGNSIYSAEAADALRDVLTKLYAEEDLEEGDPPIKVDFEHGICYACGKLMEEAGYKDDAAIMLHWGQIDLVNF